MEIIKVKDYKVFAQKLEQKTGCNITIKLMGSDHTHYQLDKIGLSLGVLCIDKGVASFAPLNTMDKVTNAEFINIQSFPLFDDLIDLFAIFRKMFVETEE